MPPINQNGITRKELNLELTELQKGLEKIIKLEIYNTKETIKLLTGNQNRIQEDLYDKDKGLFVACAKHREAQKQETISIEKRTSIIVKLVIGLIITLLGSSGVLYALIKHSMNNIPK